MISQLVRIVKIVCLIPSSINKYFLGIEFIKIFNSIIEKYQFLPKVWAKQKIENLLIQYYALDPNSSQALALKQQIIDLSLAFGVITPFTSFSNPFNRAKVCPSNMQEISVKNLSQNKFLKNYWSFFFNIQIYLYSKCPI